MRFSRARLIAAFCAAALILGCAREPAETERPIVVVSVPPQADLVERLAGDFVDVVVMVPPGVNPVTYEPTMSQMRAMSKMRLYVMVGHPHFPFEEAWLDRIAEEAGKGTFFNSSAAVPHRDEDPHIWLAPSCMRSMAVALGVGLVEKFPDHEQSIRDNLERLTADIDRLDGEIRSRLDRHRGKKFLVFHPAWGYFAEEYGLEQVSIEHDHKEPSSADLAYLIEHAREENVKVVFVQPQFSEESAGVVAEAIGAEVAALDPLARDWFANMRTVAAALDKALSP